MIIDTIAMVCLAMNIFLEARTEPMQGQIAVAQVTMRRADFNQDKVCTTVLARKQFSWTNGTDGNAWKKGLDGEAWVQAQTVARRVLLWARLRHFRDRSRGATHYTTRSITPPIWTKDFFVTARIGNHIFYKQR